MKVHAINFYIPLCLVSSTIAHFTPGSLHRKYARSAIDPAGYGATSAHVPTTPLTSDGAQPKLQGYGPTVGTAPSSCDQSNPNACQTCQKGVVFSPELKQLVNLRLEKSANHSWEWGTQAEWILEGKYPSLSVYSDTQLPLNPKANLPYPAELFTIIDPILQRRAPGIGPIIVDDAAGDPASLLIGVMVMGATVKNSPYGWDQAYYNQVAKDQIDFLLQKIRRSKEGAVSHRVKELQLWDDNLFMAPPSIMYYGAAMSDLYLVQFGYEQAKAYRQVTQDPVTKTRYHILLGSYEDKTLWSTGNGWVTAGCMRMWATLNLIQDPEIKARAKAWQDDLIEWTIEIIVGAYSFQSPTTFLLPDRYTTPGTFDEVSGTSLLAASAYRVAVARPDLIHRLPLDKINCARSAIITNHINPINGSVAPVINPLDWSKKALPGVVSPEGQAFVLFMENAWQYFIRSPAGRAYQDS
ncbi:uncharacterized protein MELLADRAFT_95282 [Melampsora larici-populina 98AG31]|uniref:Family 88 glycosyl hydrolase n=1 Tax=Melampsora larici-populina (strain 98AG31 / pathotype 3-4-7) TaxID=747676 RepID=F4RCV8_MELLP|nr:uncharacterized protein MELLADRAFT_95282 [Melampsora larici-populina 98AG31]EGG09920.1 hypothetical protein MELLADRAFT_95282 [Melampsora larici-populina 98AG31]